MSISPNITKLNSSATTPSHDALDVRHVSTSIPPELISAALALWRQRGECHAIVATGQSMLPFISDGDHLLVCHDVLKVRRGSVIVFRQKNMLIAHRVIKVLPGPPVRYVTKGDNAWRYDSPITEEQVIGHVLAIQGKFRLIMLNNRRWWMVGWLLAGATIATTAFYARLRCLRRYHWGLVILPDTRRMKARIQVILTALLKYIAYLERVLH